MKLINWNFLNLESSDDDTESGASGVNAGNGAAEDGTVADGVVEEKSKCKKVLLLLGLLYRTTSEFNYVHVDTVMTRTYLERLVQFLLSQIVDWLCWTLRKMRCLIRDREL